MDPSWQQPAPTSLSLPTTLPSMDPVSAECDLTGYQKGALLILGWHRLHPTVSPLLPQTLRSTLADH